MMHFVGTSLIATKVTSPDKQYATGHHARAYIEVNVNMHPAQYKQP